MADESGPLTGTLAGRRWALRQRDRRCQRH